MTPNECMVAALQFAGIGSASQVPKEVVVRAMNAEAQIVASMFPILVQEDITTDADGQFDLSGLTSPMVVTNVYDANGDAVPKRSP